MKYVLAYHRRDRNASELSEAHKDLKRHFRWADPEVMLLGVAEWEAYHGAEVAAFQEKPISPDRIKAIDRLGYALFDAIGERRKAARNAPQ